MNSKRLVIRNLLWSSAGMAVAMGVGFIVAPFLVRRLGETTYGLWIVIGSLTSYCGLLELGVRGSVGRHIAFHRAKGDQQGVNATLSTGLTLLGALGLIGCLGILGFMPCFFRVFPDVPADQIVGVRAALVLVAVNLVLTLALDAFDATLWGFQRFDLVNAIDIPAGLLRAVLTLWLVGAGYGLVALAAITLAVTVVDGSAKVACCFFENRALRLGWGYVDRRAFREILGYGVWTAIGTVARMTRAQFTPLIIASLLGVALATPYEIAGKPLTYAVSVLVAATGFLTPWATALHAQEQKAAQQSLLIFGGKYCCGLALFLTTLLVFLGKSLITLWIGPALAYAAPMLAVLALGELWPNSQFATNGMILAMARHRMLAYLYVVEGVVAVALLLVLVKFYGLFGACVAVAVPAALCRGLGLMVQGCRLAGLPVLRYATEVLLWPFVAAVLPGTVLGLAVAWKLPATWPQLILYTVAYTALFLVSWAAFVGLEPGMLPKRRSGAAAAAGLLEQAGALCEQ